MLLTLEGPSAALNTDHAVAVSDLTQEADSPSARTAAQPSDCGEDGLRRSDRGELFLKRRRAVPAYGSALITVGCLLPDQPAEGECVAQGELSELARPFRRCRDCAAESLARTARARSRATAFERRSVAGRATRRPTSTTKGFGAGGRRGRLEVD